MSFGGDEAVTTDVFGVIVSIIVEFDVEVVGFGATGVTVEPVATVGAEVDVYAEAVGFGATGVTVEPVATVGAEGFVDV